MNESYDALGHFDGMTADTSGYLYVIDTGGGVLRINLSDYSSTVIATVPSHTQDCVFDIRNNRLLVGIYGAGNFVREISLPDGNMTTLVADGYSHLDGIAIDDLGHVFTSSHAEDGVIVKYDSDFSGGPEVLSTGHSQPAGLCYNVEDRMLAVSIFDGNRVDFIADPFYFDSDDDGLVDGLDNCPNVVNPEQDDEDVDGVGDLCDNCFYTPNPDQLDNDSDGDGDLCDDDDDDDTVMDSVDNCQFVENPGQLDDDLDSLGNVCDNCPSAYNPYQYDEDDDGEGDACEADGIYIQCCIDMPTPYLGEPYEYQFWAVGGTPPYTWNKVSGQLPFGLTLEDDGTITGTPSYEATSVFYVSVADENVEKDYMWVTMNVQIKPIPPYICGDADDSESVDIDDVVFLISYIFAGGPAPDPLEAGDSDCSGGVDIDDAVCLINYIFAGGNDPCDPDGDGVPDC
jgi:hypothetical protein